MLETEAEAEDKILGLSSINLTSLQTSGQRSVAIVILTFYHFIIHVYFGQKSIASQTV